MILPILTSIGLSVAAPQFTTDLIPVNRSDLNFANCAFSKSDKRALKKLVRYINFPNRKRLFQDFGEGYYHCITGQGMTPSDFFVSGYLSEKFLPLSADISALASHLEHGFPSVLSTSRKNAIICAFKSHPDQIRALFSARPFSKAERASIRKLGELSKKCFEEEHWKEFSQVRFERVTRARLAIAAFAGWYVGQSDTLTENDNA